MTTKQQGERCPKCGSLLALVGRVHHCTTTYKNRDPVKRKEYMKNYMRKRRKRKGD